MALNWVSQIVSNIKVFLICIGNWFFTIANLMKNIFNSKNRIFVNSLWYFFVIIFLGQLGPIIGYAVVFWDSGPIVVKIQDSAGKAELLTCATAILAGGAFFLIREYNSYSQIRNRNLKSWIILWTAFLGLVCILATAKLLANPGLSNDRQSYIHWGLYSLTLLTSFSLWLMEEMQGTAVEEVQKLEKGAVEMTKKSADSDSLDNGVKL
jgi:uncharacterized membrane protein YjfL (UPF0719 family)